MNTLNGQPPQRIWVDPTLTGEICTTFQDGDLEYVRAGSASPLPQAVWDEAIRIADDYSKRWIAEAESGTVFGYTSDEWKAIAWAGATIKKSLESAKTKSLAASPLPTAEVDDLNPNEQYLLSVFRENLCSDPVCEGERFSASQDVLKGAVEHAEVAHAVQRYMTEQSLAGRGDPIPSAEVDKATPRPWRSDVFAVYDANGRHMTHTGGCDGTNEEKIARATLIVAAVNAYQGSQCGHFKPSGLRGARTRRSMRKTFRPRREALSRRISNSKTCRQRIASRAPRN